MERKDDRIVTQSLKALNGSYYGIWSPAGLGSSRSAVVQLRVLWSGVWGEGGTWLKQEELGPMGLGRGKGMTDGPRGECQNHKSNLCLTPSSYKVYLHFHIASTFKTSMFRHLKAKWRTHLSWHRSPTEDNELGPVYPTLTWLPVSSYLPLLEDHSKNLLLIADSRREFLFILSRSRLCSSPAELWACFEAFRDF